MRRLFFALMMAPTIAAAQQVSCPLTLPEGSVKVERAPANWVGSTHLAHLSSAGMMTGHPSRLGYMIPSSAKKTKGGAADIWEFQAGEEKWFWCGYGSGVIELAKRMDDNTTRCTITGKEERRGVYAEVTAVCK